MNLGKILVPVVTPFKDDGSIDFDKFTFLLKDTCKQDYCESVMIMATTGEFASLDFSERVQLIKCAREAIKDKPLIAATGAVTTDETIKLTKAAQTVGVDVALILPPYYYRPNQNEIFEHFKAVAMSTDIPIIIYNLVITGVNVNPDITLKLAEIDNFIGVKEIGPQFFQTAEVMTGVKAAGFEERFKIYAGSAKLSLPLLVQGASGVVTEGLIGNYVKNILDNYYNGNVAKANEIYLNKIIPYFRIYNQCGVVPGIKYALNVLGYDVGNPRMPLKELNEEQKSYAGKIFKELGIFK